MTSYAPLESEREAAVWMCEAALKEVVTSEAAIAARELRALTSARRGPYLRHTLRLARAIDERDDAVERLAAAIGWLRDLGEHDAETRYQDRLGAMVALARLKTRAALAGPRGLN